MNDIHEALAEALSICDEFASENAELRKKASSGFGQDVLLKFATQMVNAGLLTNDQIPVFVKNAAENPADMLERVGLAVSKISKKASTIPEATSAVQAIKRPYSGSNGEHKLFSRYLG